MTPCGHKHTTMPGEHHWVCVRDAEHPDGKHYYAKVEER
jgi:hypothetical protein